MLKTKIEDNIFMLSMNVEDILFENMWELPDGVSLNSYIVRGENTAIIDGVIGWDGVPETLYSELSELGIKVEDIKYVVINHLEPDHSGWLHNFKKIHSDFTVVTTAKGKPILEAFYGHDLNVMIVGEGDALDLGNGKVLSFHPTPNVHWPETMLTFEQSTKTIFTCDMFGAFGVLKEGYLYDDYSHAQQVFFDHEAARYYSNVLTTFSPMVKRSIGKTIELNPSLIAPGHGPLYRNSIKKIISLYEDFTMYAKGMGKKEIAVLFGSMYGGTKKVVQQVVEYIESKGIRVHALELPGTTESEVVSKVFSSIGVIVAAPTYEYKMFPPVAHALDELGRKKINGKDALFFGSFGWNSGASREFLNIVDTYKMKWNVVNTIEFEGKASEKDIESIIDSVDVLIDQILQK